MLEGRRHTHLLMGSLDTVKSILFQKKGVNDLRDRVDVFALQSDALRTQECIGDILSHSHYDVEIIYS